MNPDVLIAGAGPTGLVLAIWLARRGVSLRIIDQTAEPGTTSRALAVHARTLEYYRMLGFADETVAEGQDFGGANIRVLCKPVGKIRLGQAGAGISPFPFVLTYPQDEHERLLIRKLEELGVTVERSTKLLSLANDEDGVRASIQRPDGSVDEVQAKYLCGCDGAHSTVRKALGIEFPGGLYEQAFFVADAVVQGETADGELHGCLGDSEFCLVFPMKGERRVRLIGIIPKPLVAKADARELTLDDLRSHVESLTSLKVEKSNWFSTYRIHHRVADSFGEGRVFLLGDAAHIHSPAGGQGMNTGIGDAVDLAWKLVDVLKQGGSPKLLESHGPERRAFALKLVATTDRAFQGLVDPAPLARFFRLRVAARLIPFLTRFQGVRRKLFKVVSQTGIQYRSGPLSRGAVGEIRAGDRLPWYSETDGSDPHACLRDMTWQVHVHGEPTPELRQTLDGRGLTLTVFRWSKGAEAAGYKRDALYLVRPDGHVGFAGEKGDHAALAAYWDELYPATSA